MKLVQMYVADLPNYKPTKFSKDLKTVDDQSLWEETQNSGFILSTLIKKKRQKTEILCFH